MVLHVAFLWHMHQPSYRDPVTGEVLLPWVRLHGVKDYTDMATALVEVPEARVTVNWVPGLLDQCEAMQTPEYGRRERFWRLSERPAAELTAGEIQTIREHFFSLPDATMLTPHARYRELRDLVRQGSPLSTAELRDLQTWFNLAWTGVTARAHPVVQDLLARGRDFSEDDKANLLEVQRQTVLDIIPRWRALAQSGAVELSTSPYYHPILPLLCDSDLARAADPSTPLPKSRFRWRGDAEAQIRRATVSHQRRFGAAPKGMWPSEGSVTAEVLPLVRAAGLRWLVTDEAILWKSLAGTPGASTRSTDKFRPWSLDGVTLLFRDHGLSDKIGFVYASWPYPLAYADFVQNLLAIARVTEPDGDAVVTVALDGENCWEHYPGGVTAFLPGLLRAIAETPGLALATVSETLDRVPARPLPGLATGSWIDGTFRTWLGDPVKNQAWDLITTARQAVQRPMNELLASDPGLADLVLRAEASDWWWWFGEGHSSPFDDDFDALFRAHLMAIWLALGKPVPEILQQRVQATATGGPAGPITQRGKRPMTQLEVELDGTAGWYFKWLGAGEVHQSYGSIHRAESLISRLLYGNDEAALYLRLDARERCDTALAGVHVELVVQRAREPLVISLWPASEGVVAACGEVLEARIPLSVLGVTALPGRVRGRIELSTNGDASSLRAIERFPGTGELELDLISALDAALNVGV